MFKKENIAVYILQFIHMGCSTYSGPDIINTELYTRRRVETERKKWTNERKKSRWQYNKSATCCAAAAAAAAYVYKSLSFSSHIFLFFFSHCHRVRVIFSRTAGALDILTGCYLYSAETHLGTSQRRRFHAIRQLSEPILGNACRLMKVAVVTHKNESIVRQGRQ